MLSVFELYPVWVALCFWAFETGATLWAIFDKFLLVPPLHFFRKCGFWVTIGSLRIDDFPEDDDVSTLEVVYAHALPDVALFRASS